MSTGTPLVCPIEPHEMDKALRAGINDIVRRVTCAAAMQGVGRELLTRVYLAGLFHGVALARHEPVGQAE